VVVVAAGVGGEAVVVVGGGVLDLVELPHPASTPTSAPDTKRVLAVTGESWSRFPETGLNGSVRLL
jgi:hypothetical protein